jgi:hypothetical protein
MQHLKNAIDTTTLFRYDYIQKIDATFNAVLKNIRELELQMIRKPIICLTEKSKRYGMIKLQAC